MVSVAERELCLEQRALDLPAEEGQVQRALHALQLAQHRLHKQLQSKAGSG